MSGLLNFIKGLMLVVLAAFATFLAFIIYVPQSNGIVTEEPASVSTWTLNTTEQIAESKMDTEKASATATATVTALFTYDQSSLTDGSWLENVTSLTSTDAAKHIDTGNYINTFTVGNWTVNAAASSLASSVIDTTVVATSTSLDPLDGEAKPVVEISATIVRSPIDTEPQSPYNKGTSKYEDTYIVHLDANCKAVWSVQRVSSKDLTPQDTKTEPESIGELAGIGM